MWHYSLKSTLFCIWKRLWPSCEQNTISSGLWHTPCISQRIRSFRRLCALWRLLRNEKHVQSYYLQVDVHLQCGMLNKSEMMRDCLITHLNLTEIVSSSQKKHTLVFWLGFAVTVSLCSLKHKGLCLFWDSSLLELQ